MKINFYQSQKDACHGQFEGKYCKVFKNYYIFFVLGGEGKV